MIRNSIFMAPEGAPVTPAAPSPGTPAAPVAPATPATPAVPVTPAPVAAPATGTALTDPTPAPVAAAPAEWKPVVPEGVTVEKSLLDGIASWAKDGKIDGKEAQKIVDLQVKAQKDAGVKRLETVTGWAEEAKADKEIGGANFEQSRTLAKKAVDRFASPALKELLSQSGLGNHKEMIRLFSQVGKLIAEDRVPGSGAAPPPAAEPSRDEALHAAFPQSPGMFPAAKQ